MLAKVFPLLISALLVLNPGMTTGQALNSDSRLRLETLALTGADYTLLLPEALLREEPVPLVVALHYGGYTPPHYGRLIAQQLIAPALAALGAVVVAPDCAQGAWQYGHCEETVLGLIDHLKQSLPIANDRVVLTGYSMGGIGTWELASRHPELFSAAVVMAGKPSKRMGNIAWNLPLYVIHARDDELMPLADTEIVVGSIRAKGGQVALEILDGVSHFQTENFVGPLRATIPWLREVWQQAR